MFKTGSQVIVYVKQRPRFEEGESDGIDGLVQEGGLGSNGVVIKMLGNDKLALIPWSNIIYMEIMD